MLDVIREFSELILKNKKYWMVPIFLAFILVGLLLFYVSGTVLAPFIYTLF